MEYEVTLEELSRKKAEKEEVRSQLFKTACASWMRVIKFSQQLVPPVIRHVTMGHIF